MNVMTTSEAIHNRLVEVVNRNNEKIKMFNTLPTEVRQHMDTEVFDDIEFLLRYISALQNLLSEVTDEQPGAKFEF